MQIHNLPVGGVSPLTLSVSSARRICAESLLVKEDPRGFRSFQGLELSTGGFFYNWVGLMLVVGEIVFHCGCSRVSRCESEGLVSCESGDTASVEPQEQPPQMKCPLLGIQLVAGFKRGTFEQIILFSFHSSNSGVSSHCCLHFRDK